MSDDTHPWERQRDEGGDLEPGLWFSRFDAFRLMDHTRSLLGCVNAERERRGAKRRNSVPGSWFRAFKCWHWAERTEAWDAWQRAEDEATWRERRRSALERDWSTGDKLLSLAEQILNEGPKFLKATTRTVKGRPAKVDTEGKLLDPGEPDQRVTIIALSADLAVKASLAGSDLARRATGLDVQRHEITGKEGGPIETKDVSLSDAERLAALTAMQKRVSAEAGGQPAGEGDA